MTRNQLKRVAGMVAVFSCCAAATAPAGFVTVSGDKFVDGAREFHFAGTNNYYLIYKSNAMIDDVLSDAAAMGLKVVRAWGFINGQPKDGKVTQPSLGVYDPSGFERLDYAVWRAKQAGLRLLIPFVNNWDEFGGMNWYVAQTGGGSHDDFYTRASIKAAYRNYVSHLLNRVNQYTGVAYKDEPAVFAWELANEPRCSSDPTGNTLLAWADEMSAWVKGLDANHLVGVGDEGFLRKSGQGDWTRNGSEGVDWGRLAALPHIDFATVHLYPDHWGKTAEWGTAWINEHLTDGAALGKPVVLEEFGYQAKPARDGVYQEWLTALELGGGAASLFWILTAVQDDGSPYPDYDGFDVKYPGATATVLAQHAAAMTAKNEPRDPGMPSLAVADAAVDQPATGMATAVFAVTLSAAVAGEVAVNYATADGTAVAGNDYVAASGVVTFAPGETARNIVVAVNSGTLPEGGSRNFTMRLSAPSGANLGDAVATCIIRGTTVPPAPEAGASVAFAFTNQWAGGAQAAFTITNNGATAINGWTLEFDWAGEISNLWNGVIESHVGQHYVVRNAGYNANISPGGSAEVGCVVNLTTAGSLPSNITLNGTPAGGGGGGVITTPSLAVGDASVTLQAEPTGVSNGYLSTQGNQIVDSGGNPVRITGINWFGFETGNRVFHGLWTRNCKHALDQIKQLGFNTLRIPFSNAMLQAGAATNSINFSQNPELQGLTPLQCLDRVVDHCGQIGLRVILDRHSARADGYMNEDLWHVPADTYFTEQRWIEDWVMLATRYANNPTVIGADLFNEPKKTATWGNSAPATDWNKAAERCGNAILAANPNWLIIVEGVERFNNQTYWWGGNLKGAAGFPVILNRPDKLVYSMHDYPASVYNQTWFSAPDYPNNLDSVWDAHWGYLFKNNTAPLLLGEFGSKLATVVDRQWLDKLTDYIDGDFDLNGSNDLAAGKKGISWTYWCFNPNSGDTGGILNDDWTTVDQAKLGYLTASMAPMFGAGNGGAAAQEMVFSVTLSGVANGTVTVNWSTVDGTAVAGTDYTGGSGTLSFNAGETTKLITVRIPAHDAAVAKQFTVQLSAASGATIADGSGTGTILPAGGTSTSAWESWQGIHFTPLQIAVPGMAGMQDEPLRDGMANLLKYAFGGTPWTAAAALAPEVTGGADGRLTIAFSRSTEAADVDLTVQAAELLSGPWLPIARSVGGGVTSALQAGVEASESGSGVVREVIVRDLPWTGGSRFLRVEVSK